MKVALTSTGRFHYFHLARILEEHFMLGAIFTGYPSWKLKDEVGIPTHKIQTFPWFQVPLMASGKLRWLGSMFSETLRWKSVNEIDRFSSTRIADFDVLIAMGGTGLISGTILKARGGFYICDRVATHINFQNSILKEEYKIWNKPYRGLNPSWMEKEQTEYQIADKITVPSQFVLDSFVKEGIDPRKLKLIPYGARLSRFTPSGFPHPDRFRVLFVGQVSLRKGFLYLLKAFNDFRHPNKELKVIGAMYEEVQTQLHSFNLEGVEFLGIVSNKLLSKHYSEANVLVLPSIEEGLAYVQGEALACGCPVIASVNSGAGDLFTDGVEGFIIPIRDPSAILEKLENLSQDKGLWNEMSKAAHEKVKAIEGWDTYGRSVINLIESHIS